MRSCFSLTLLIVMLLSQGCGNSARISISKQSANVSRVVFNAATRPPEVGPDAMAATTWDFMILSSFKSNMDILEQSNTETRISVKIEAVDLKLDLNIKQHLPEAASDRLQAHEQGHVDICKRVYATADKEAAIAAKQVLGRIFQASGTNVETAKASALKKAHQVISSYYEQKTAGYARSVSLIYDELEGEQGAGSSVDRAFSVYADK